MNKMTIIVVAASVFIASQGKTVLAQDDQVRSELSPQTPGTVQEQGSPQMRKGYPGLQLRKADDKPRMTSERRDKMNLLIEDESKQLKALREDRTLSKEQKKERYLQIRQATRDKIRALLPPKEQKKYEESLAKTQAIQEAMRKKTVPKVGR